MATRLQRPQRRFRTADWALAYYATRDSEAQPTTTLRQYELVRTEIVASLGIQVQILSFGTATLGLVAGAAFIGPNESSRSDVLVVFLPLLAYFALITWFSEVMRMLRAGGFLLTLERKLDDLDDGSLAWEASVFVGRYRYRAGKHYYHFLDPDHLRLSSVTLLFFTIAAASVWLGWDGASWAERIFALVTAGVAVVVITAVYHLRINQMADILGIEERPFLSRKFRDLATRERKLSSDQHPERGSSI